MRRIGAYEAKTHLPRLLDEVANGEAITITKHGVAIARLAPASTRPTLTAHEAIAGLRAFRRAHPRDGLSLRELIDEGRRLCSSWTPRWPRRSVRSWLPRLSALRSVQVEGVPLDAALGEVTELARQLDLTAYDAAYLALAARRGLALATVDDRLRRACERAGVELVG